MDNIGIDISWSRMVLLLQQEKEKNPMNLYFWIGFVTVITIWDGIWKGIALWKSARNNQPGWFIPIFTFNTIGILPMIYLKKYQKKVE